MGVKNFLSEFKLYLCNEWVSSLPSHRLRLLFYRRLMKFSMGKDCSVFLHCSFDCSGGLEMGTNSVINPRCRLDTRGGIIIGNNVSISQEVVILTADHDRTSAGFIGRNREVIIGDLVWIGTRAMILPGVRIGKGAMIAAGAVVTKDVEPFTVVAGVPARAVNKRREDVHYHSYYRRLFQ